VAQKVAGVDDIQKITPWDVEAGDEGVDYDKLIRDFGSSKIEPVRDTCIVDSTCVPLTGLRVGRLWSR
jgi:hypothetical protein